MLLELVILGIAIIANSTVGILVFLRNTKSATSKFFFLLSVALTCWVTVTYLSVHTDNLSLRLFWTRAVMVTAIGQALYFYLLARSFPEISLKMETTKLRLLFAGGTLVSAIALSPFLFTSLVRQADGSYNPTPGPGFLLFLPYALGLIGTGLWILIRKMTHAHGIRKTQVNLLLTGLTLMFLLIIFFNLLFPLLFHYSKGIVISPLFTVIFVGFTAYAIVTQHLFDIRLVIKRTVIFTSLVTLTFAIYTVIILLLSRIFQQGNTSFQGFAINLVAALAVGFSFEPMQKWISERTDKWLFKKEYEQQVVIAELSKNLNDVIAMDEALEIVMQTIVRVLHLKHAVTYVFQRGEKNSFGVKQVKQVGYASSSRLILEDKDFTVPYFTDHPQTVLVRDLGGDLEREEELLKKSQDGEFVRAHAIKQAVVKKLESLEGAVAVPLHLNGQPIGLIILSEKLNGEAYHQGDLSLLEVVGGQAISSIQKAKLYEGDQMKSEFVSIASHELLTPISAIEGYLSMILEENIGQVDEKARDYLGKVYTSAKRLSLLIKDLLSVSRIESGKMKIEPQQLDMNKMITDTTDQLRFMAANKNLTLNFEAKTIPLVWADPDRTMQIMVNLVSNSIKYTKEGSITISIDVEKRDGFLRTSITDTGIGMSKAQMQHLFTQFYRVQSDETTGIAGTGLGLYICKSIIEKMGGNIDVKSVTGKGTTFSFTLPLFKVETSTLT